MKPPSLKRVFLTVGIVVVLAAAFAWTWFYVQAKRHALPAIETTRLRMEYEALARYAARETKGAFLPPGAITIALDERFVQRVISSSLPFETWVSDSTIAVRLESARFDVERGFGRVVLGGIATLASDTTMFAELLIQGVVGIRSLDYSTEQLGLGISITDVEVVRSGPSGLAGLTNPVAAYFGRQKAADLNAIGPRLDIPLQLAHSIELEASEGDVDVPATSLPLRTRLLATTSFSDLLVASVELLPDTLLGEPAGPPAGPWDAPPGRTAAVLNNASAAVFAPTPERIEAISRKVAGLAGRDSLWQAIVTSERDITVIVPQVVVADVVDRLARRYREGISIDVTPNLREHVVEDLHVKVLGKRVKAGEIDLDILVRRLAGRLKSSRAPTTRLIPPDAVELQLPLAIEDGHGSARITANWDPNAAAWLVCKGFTAEQTLVGRIRPIPYVLHGRLRFELGPDRILARPTLRRDRVRLRIDLNEASWDSVRSTFAKQDKFLKCGMVMSPEWAVEKLQALGARGIRVRLPGAAPPFDLPVRFEKTIETGDVRVAVLVHDPAVIVREVFVQIGLDVELEVEAAEPPARAEPSAPAAPAAPLSPAAPGVSTAGSRARS